MTIDMEIDNSAEKGNASRNERLEDMFKNMRLRRIVKENHGYNISQLGFFFNNKHSEAPGSLEHHKAFDKRGVVQRDSADTSNVLGTVGGCELSVYDNEHCGDHLDIMSNFDITPEDESLVHKHQLETFCWSYRDGDVLLATAGGDGLVHIISLANSEEIMALQGHKKTIYDLQSHPHNDNMILSTSKDGTMRLWDIHSGQCLVVFEADATVACFDYSGTKLISGGSRGDLRLWNIPSSMNMMDDEPIVVEKRHSRLLKKLHGDSYIDCIRFVGGHVLSKSTNGKMEYWELEGEKSIKSFRIRSGENFSRFDVSFDEKFFCVGSSHGTIYIYNLDNGKLVTELGHRRATKAVRCCAFSRDCRQIVAAGEDGFILRYDYIDEETLEEWGNWKKAE